SSPRIHSCPCDRYHLWPERGEESGEARVEGAPLRTPRIPQAHHRVRPLRAGRCRPE
ncbi:hypothetical protein AK812_SmicGene48016, partial [Symbiodinium microadriaticum]